ncbi:2-amino-4-hydroxy-6-hydroxymethyldihydropteridine diphosphokinase [Celeribacter sp.]|uniref:2-amino-4-hydroxy-6- hydroxymethyldihydropteridine diphosphokinase n=1 Tax=Celeribacter sp. TaxID=1890673 RepID=UPI003A90CD9E
MKFDLSHSASRDRPAFIALGSNQPSFAGPPKETLRAALEMMAEHGFVVARESRFYETPAFPAGSGPNFVNAVVGVETSLSPSELLLQLHEIERAFGRERKERWAARPLDLDLLAYGDVICPDVDTVRDWMALPLDEQMARAPEGLVLPHPRLAERSFVLIPFSDVAADWTHPITGKSVADMLRALPVGDIEAVKPL